MEILKRLSHPNVIALLDSGSAAGVLWFAMEFIEGKSAAELVAGQGPLPLERVHGLGRQLAEALECAHGQGFVHRDVKPGNLLVREEAGREVLKLADFGLARVYQASALSGLTLAGTSGGTPGFMPPEQLLDFRAAQPPADQYALAATVYFLLTGALIYEASESLPRLLNKILTSEPLPVRSPPVGVPPRLVQALNRALAREPQARYPSVRAMWEAVEKSVSGS
jgi:serine/threonine-protein kinase